MTISVSYDPLEVDALGRLVQVREYLGTNPYTGYTTTTYGYDAADRLTDVWDEGGNHTQLTYDRLGRKTAMYDPDMGSWSYVYDALGNLTQQTDARGQTISFSYDILNRVTFKDLPGSASDVTYQYDNVLGDAATANSWGKLRRAYVGASPTTNAHQYQYDSRGRTSWERVTLDGTDYDTSYTYDSADRVQTMTYPGGEVVTYGYLPSGMLNSAVGNDPSPGQTTYLGQATYTPWGAVDLMKLGPAASPILQVDYDYYPWDGSGGEGRGRLSRMTAGTLQDLRYTDYDLVGNVRQIQDWKAGSPQTQSFSYDDLDRLLSAAASGGTYGNYSESYAYDGNNGKLGNLTSKGGMGYTYPAAGSAQPHAVRRVNGSGGSSKTIVIYAKKSGTATPTMKLYINGQYQAQWNVTATAYYGYSTSKTLSGNDVIEVVYTNDDGSRDLYVDKVVVDGTVIQAEGGAAVLDQGTGSAAFDGREVVVGAELFPGNGALRLVKGAQAMALGYDANGNMTGRVREGEGQVLTYDAENRLVKVEKSGATLAEFVYGPGGERVKGTVNGVTTVYVGDHYEKVTIPSPPMTIVRKYYYAGSQRVAMREGNTLYWLLTDHLGSQAITANADGSFRAEVRYKAWGEDRYTNGTTPTAYRYTGQRAESGIGLYDYGARWYDPTLGRWLSPDTLIPQPANPQSLNRYSYVLNGPIRYVDPSGHVTVEETATYIQGRWGIEVIPANWQVWELDWVIAGLVRLTNALGGEGILQDVLGITFGHSVAFFRQSPDFYCTKFPRESDVKPRGLATPGRESDMLGLFPGYGSARVYFGDRAFEGSAEETARVVIHELAHVMDYQANGAYSRDMLRATGGYVGDYGDYHPGGNTATEYGRRSPGEDWAESLAAYLCPNAADVRAWGRWRPGSPRFNFVRSVFQDPWYRL